MATPHYVREILETTLNICMCAEDRSSPFATSVRYDDAGCRKLPRSYAKGVNYLMKKYGTDQAIAENDTAIFC